MGTENLFIGFLAILVLSVTSCAGVVEVKSKEVEQQRVSAVTEMVNKGADPLRARCAVYYNEPMCSIQASK